MFDTPASSFEESKDAVIAVVEAPPEKETRRKPSLSLPNAAPGTVITRSSSNASATFIDGPYPLTSSIV